MDERAELAPALSELAAALHALIPVLLDNGQAPLTPQQIVDIAAKVMPGCQHAAAVMIDQDRPQTLAKPTQCPTTLMPSNSTSARARHWTS